LKESKRERERVCEIETKGRRVFITVYVCLREKERESACVACKTERKGKRACVYVSVCV